MAIPAPPQMISNSQSRAIRSPGEKGGVVRGFVFSLAMVALATSAGVTYFTGLELMRLASARAARAPLGKFASTTMR